MKPTNILMTNSKNTRTVEKKGKNFLKIADRISLGYGLILLALIIYSIALAINIWAEF